MRQGLAERGPQSTALPVEIGFLARHGYPPGLLQEAGLIAEMTGISADQVLLKQGLVEETAFYRALAAELGLPFLTAPRLSPQARYPESILAGLAPLAQAEDAFVIAPTGAVLARLLQGMRVASRIAVTSPSRLQKAIFAHQGRMIAHRAAHRLHDAAPQFSSRDGSSIFQIVMLVLAALLLSFCGVAAAGETLAVASSLVSPLFLGMIVLRLAASALSNPVHSPLHHTLRDADLPIYTIIVALYQERNIASGLIRALKRIHYPAAKLDIKLVLEADDHETLSTLKKIDLPGNIDILVAPPGEPRTKPRALNVALPLARGRFTVVYDAEDVPDPEQLRLAVATFSSMPPDVACLQARLTIDNTNDSWLTRLFTIEYAALFDVFNPGLAIIGSPIPLGGTSNHFRTSLLKRIHGWDAWNVTEDADLGIRLARLGFRVDDLPSSTFEEAPITLSAWMRQRTRWMKGYMQTSISHSRHVMSGLSQLGFWRFYAGTSLMAGAVLSALLYPFCTGLFALLWLSQRPEALWASIWYVQSLTLFLAGAASMFIPAIVALHRRRLWRLLPWVGLLPAYYALVSLAAWRGLWELLTAPKRWNKTTHGLARTSRSGMFQKHQANVVETKSLKIAPP